MPERKRLTLVAALILKQVARSLDDAAEMFIRQVQKMHNKASDALVLYRAAHAERTDALIARLREIALAFGERNGLLLLSGSDVIKVSWFVHLSFYVRT